MVRRRLPGLVAIGTCIGWGAVSGLIIALETRYDYAAGPDWPSRFAWAAPVTWAIVAAIVTLVVVESTSNPTAEVPEPCDQDG